GAGRDRGAARSAALWRRPVLDSGGWARAGGRADDALDALDVAHRRDRALVASAGATALTIASALARRSSCWYAGGALEGARRDPPELRTRCRFVRDQVRRVVVSMWVARSRRRSPRRPAS